VLLVAGAAIAPAEASVYAMVDDAAPRGTTTEAFAWLASAMAVGGALGAAASGALIDRAGSNAAFAFGGCAGALAVLVIALRAHTLVARPAYLDTDDSAASPTGGHALRAASNPLPGCS
jgi:predicted MFS family arabinose efflux permease